MSFGGQNSSPWQRNNMMQNQVQSYSQQQMFMQQQSGYGGGNYQSNNGSVGYPQRGLNPVAFSNTGGGGQSQHYNSIGTVTKINNDCGLVNDEVIFYRNVCKGQIPKLGDRVLFEASFATTGNYKWNATRIQLMGSQAQPPPLMGTSTGSGRKGSGYNAVPPPNEYDHQNFNSPRRSSPVRDRHGRGDRERREPIRRSRDRDDVESDRKRRREDTDRNREVISSTRSAVSRSERDRDDLKREREKEREKERSPHRAIVKGRRPRVIPRYMVQIPRSNLVYKNADIQEIRERFNNLYIPSDFFNASLKWSEAFTPDNPFSLRRPCQFHIMHKIVETPFESKPEELEPNDVDYLYTAKVMLMALPPIAEMYQKCFENDESENAQHLVHPSRLISFLVGTRGRHEPMAIGGPWSPSMDGKNPDKDPSVLIRTAIRTCKALTGIDLSNCTQWYRFMELHYHRTDYKHKKKDGPPRVETVVIFVPDVHSCMPTTTQWQNLAETYKTSVENVIARKIAAAKSTVALEVEDASPAGNSTLANNSVTETDSKVENESTDDINADAANDGMDAEVTQTNLDISSDGDDNNIEKEGLQPTHYSKLDLKNMKVKNIKDELMARNLPSKGIRSMLMGRLAKAINAEKAEEIANKNSSKNVETSKDNDENIDKEEDEDDVEIIEEKTEENDEQEDGMMDVDMNDILILDEYDSSKNPEDTNNEFNEREKNQLIRRYSLPSEPHVIVHPNKAAKNGKFDCSVMSLSVLLDYSPDDAKERFFELSLFAELFNEMLMRDFGFTIYKELYLYEGKKVEETEAKDENNESVKDESSKDVPTEKSSTTTTDEKSTKPNNERKRKADNTNVKEKEKEKESTIRDKENSSAKDKDKAKESSVEKKMVIVKPHLLLSFIYFDVTHCGYLFQKDIEALFSVLGLNLSRGQIRAVLEKVSAHQIYYRKITDKEESLDAPPTLQDADDIPEDELKDIALGNNKYDSILNEKVVSKQSSKATSASDGLISYNGALVHVGKLMEQIKRTEKNYSDLEKLHNDLLKSHTELNKEHTKSNSKVKDLQSDVKSLNRKLSDVHQELNGVNRKYRDQQATIQFIYNRVQPYFREKEKEKHESGREKETDKDKEKEKPKEKESKDNKEKESKDTKDKESKDIKEKDSKDTKDKESKDTKDKESKDPKDKECKDIKDKEKNKQKESNKSDDKQKKAVDKNKIKTNHDAGKPDGKKPDENIPDKNVKVVSGKK
ncbi:cell division cycle and apoptosis regulator protein 1-like [Teleopsis dalmanni]|uniref:cell division cycle and apoptosis regulator protein 1-like n=1 Tax=Teleopsis dalmanni TaxID=139649 RepID=UPI0018CE70F2|nr:cell division cycle and apoptosis regulator protein 1-like [Teleopsis dalmanni]